MAIETLFEPSSFIFIFFFYAVFSSEKQPVPCLFHILCRYFVGSVATELFLMKNVVTSGLRHSKYGIRTLSFISIKFRRPYRQFCPSWASHEKEKSKASTTELHFSLSKNFYDRTNNQKLCEQTEHFFAMNFIAGYTWFRWHLTVFLWHVNCCTKTTVYRRIKQEFLDLYSFFSNKI